MYMDKDEHCFYGTHSIRANQLKELGFFPALVDILAVAPIVGFEYGRRAQRNDQDNEEKSMFLGQLKRIDTNAELNYKTIMLLDVDYEPKEEKRYQKAFQTAADQRLPEDLERYEEYVRGGVDFLYEKLVGTGNTQSERLGELYEFVESFTNRYSKQE